MPTRSWQHFANELRARYPTAWRGGHQRLYEHLQRSSDWEPDTIEVMMPLIKAVAHGCYAGGWADAATNVFFARVQRKDQDFATVQLGAPGPVLAALASFFVQPWKELLPFRTAKQAYHLSQASACLAHLGRFAEAIDATIKTLAIDSMIVQMTLPTSPNYKAYVLASGMDANSVAEHLLVLGPLSEAGGAAGSRNVRESTSLRRTTRYPLRITTFATHGSASWSSGSTHDIVLLVLWVRCTDTVSTVGRWPSWAIDEAQLPVAAVGRREGLE